MRLILCLTAALALSAGSTPGAHGRAAPGRSSDLHRGPDQRSPAAPGRPAELAMLLPLSNPHPEQDHVARRERAERYALLCRFVNDCSDDHSRITTVDEHS